MKLDLSNRLLPAASLLAAALLLSACERPPVETKQIGFRGTGMEQVSNPRLTPASASKPIPFALPAAGEGGQPASAVYQNVKVLGNLSVGEFTRTMVAMTQWVAPKEGCVYCHNPANLASDEKYTKVVSRRMLEMTQHVNATWKTHVADTGVTCYTCHRGEPVPSQLWFSQLPPAAAFLGNKAGQNAPAPSVGYASLPNDPFSAFLTGDSNIRTVSTTALPDGNRHSIKQTEWTYGLMVSMSQSLGVNCTYCHNSRSFTSWDSSPPARGVAWHGIRLVRDLNSNYLIPLADTFPPERHGVAGDGPKLHCATCHQGQSKPLNGAKMMKDYTAALMPAPAVPVEAVPAPESEVGPAEGQPSPEETSPKEGEAEPSIAPET